MLTPQEVTDRGFTKVSFGGYNLVQVDEFLDTVTKDYTTLFNENSTLKRKMKVLQEKIDEYRETEEKMRKAFSQAQQMCDQMVADAKNKSEQILEDARAVADDHRKVADEEKIAEEHKLVSLKQMTAKYVESVRELHSREIEYLDSLHVVATSESVPSYFGRPEENSYQRQEKMAYPRQEESNFGRVSSDTAPFPRPEEGMFGRTEEAYGRSPESYGRAEESSFGARPEELIYAGRPEESNFGGRSEESNFGGRPEESNFGGRPEESNFGGRPEESNFGGRPEESNFGGRPEESNFGGRSEESNFGGRSEESNFGGRSEESFGGRDETYGGRDVSYGGREESYGRGEAARRGMEQAPMGRDDVPRLRVEEPKNHGSGGGQPVNPPMSDSVQEYLQKQMNNALGEEKAAEWNEQHYSKGPSSAGMLPDDPHGMEATTRFFVGKEVSNMNKTQQQIKEEMEYDAEMARSRSSNNIDFNQFRNEYNHKPNNLGGNGNHGGQH